ncbi:uncharacterized protein BJ212DRAFT_1393937 [Suillus subaureus]|uniref:Secreted protein n=1 Tax=Suillus subaureus TaxID=48587 RepID=A0A9P7DVN4_9AGAM|nr:uncharacterized protein BJ212DRAFT_1393937 [Suillus subaureus]KAG1804414.1 hypothetical protein BJ212DRAFT_1393937 [Suillus subaureus]
MSSISFKFLRILTLHIVSFALTSPQHKLANYYFRITSHNLRFPPNILTFSSIQTTSPCIVRQLSSYSLVFQQAI